ncbi:MAG: catalase HPII, partial [Alphaproteobacteria bacterium]
QIVAPKVGGATLSDGKRMPAHHALAAGPSVLFDAVALLPSDEGAEMLLSEAAAIDWLRDAFGHLKTIGHVPAADALFDKAGVATEADEGTVSLAGTGGIKSFIAAAKKHRIWDREPAVRAAGGKANGNARRRT